jgi:hypothetical protein
MSLAKRQFLPLLENDRKGILFLGDKKSVGATLIVSPLLPLRMGIVRKSVTM